MEQIFIKLLNLSISAGYLVLALLLLRPLLKKAPKYICCCLWALVGLRLCLPFSLESVLSLIPSAETVPQDILYTTTPQINSGISFINSAVNPFLLETMTPAPLTSVNPMQLVMIIGANIWVLGMAVMVLYSAISYLVLRHRLREAVPAGDNLYLCDGIESAFLLGLFRPRIYLSSSLSGENAAYVIAHEKAHLKRKDHWWKPLGFALLTVYWFNPLMWVAYILLCRDIEYACDEKVIRQLGEGCKTAYSEALIRCSVPRKTISACPVAFGEDGIKGRIKSVLSYKKPAFWIILIALLASIAVAVCFLTDPAQDKPGQKEDLFGGVFETGVCNYSFVVSAEQETQSNELIFCIDSRGQVYKDYGSGENEYLGTLQPSDFTLDELNGLLLQQGVSTIYSGDLSACWELLDAEGKRTYIFYPESQGHAGMVSFFSDGRIMNWFALNRTGDFSSADVSLYQFSGTVLDVQDGSLLVEPFEEEAETKTSDRFWVRLPDASEEQFAVGDQVQVVYDGMIQELYPAILPNVTAVTKLTSSDETSTVLNDLLDSALFDIDGDGTDEECYIYIGPAQKVYSFDLRVYENGILEYYCTFIPNGYNDFHFSQNGNTLFTATETGGTQQEHSFYVTVSGSNLSLQESDGLTSVWGGTSSAVPTLSSVREKYPQFFGLSTEKGLEVYVWKNGEYRCGVRSGTDREAALEELWALGDGAALEEMALILCSYGIARSEISVYYTYNPAFSGSFFIPPSDTEQDTIEKTLFSGLPADEQISVLSLDVDAEYLGFDPYKEYKLVIYAYQLAEQAWCFQFVNNTKIAHSALELMTLDSRNLEDAKAALATFDIPPEDIPVIVYCNPISSYLHPTDQQAAQTARQLLGLS